MLIAAQVGIDAEVYFCSAATCSSGIIRRPRPLVIGGMNAVQGEFPYQSVLKIEDRVGRIRHF